MVATLTEATHAPHLLEQLVSRWRESKWVADMLGHKSTQILFDVYEKFTPRRTRLDGSALLARIREESRKSNVHCDLLVAQSSGRDAGGEGGGR